MPIRAVASLVLALMVFRGPSSFKRLDEKVRKAIVTRLEKRPLTEVGQDRFIAIDAEPVPLVDLQSLVEYPEDARREGLEGQVVLSLLVGRDGRVEAVEIDKSDNKVFDSAARDAMMKARFKPAHQKDEPVRVWYTVPITFKLNQR